MGSIPLLDFYSGYVFEFRIMAKNNFIRTVPLMSNEIIIDIPCKACLRKSRKSEGVKVCLTCDENLCLECATRHSNTTKTKLHKIRNREKQLPRGLHLPNVSFEEKCEDHPENFIDSYCKDHDITGCYVCMSSKHKNCDKIIYVTSSSFYIDKEKQLSEAREDINQIKKELDALRATRQQDKKNLGQEKDDIEANLLELRKKFNKMFDDLERKTKTELFELYENFSVKMKCDIQLCSDLIATLDTYVPKLSTVLRTEREAFSHVMNARASVINGWYAINFIKRASREQRLNFTLDKTIEKLFNEVNKLGYFGDVGDVFTVNVENDYNVTVETDLIKKDLVHFGTTFLHDGSLLLTDFKNKKLKHIDSSSSTLTSCEVPGRPFAVCQVDQSTCAVTLPNEQLIQLIELGKQMTSLSSFDTESKCRGICHYNEELYTTSGGGYNESYGHIRVFTLDGELSRVIDPDLRGIRYLSSPVNLIFSSDGQKLFIADRDKGIITLNLDGELIQIFCKDPLKTPQCIAADGKGGIIACDHATGNVVYIDAESQKCGILLKDGEDIKHALSVSFDVYTRRLAVAMRNSCYVKVFTLRPLA